MTGESGVLTSLLGQLGVVTSAGDDKPAGASQDVEFWNDSPTRRQTAEVLDFQRRLKLALKGYRDDSQGHLFVLRLDRVKERLGDRWRNGQEQLHDSIERIIASNVSGGDLYIRYDDLSYLLIFFTQGEKAGRLRSVAIADEIARRLVGAEATTEIVQPQSIRMDAQGKVAYQDLPPLNALVEDTLQALTTKTGGAQVPGMVDPLDRPPVTAVEHDDVVSLPNGLDYIYRPLLAVNTSVISTFLCIPSVDYGRGHYLSGYDVLHDRRDPQEIFSLDKATLRASVGEIHDLTGKGGHSLIALPVNFETLADKRRRIEYTALVDKLVKGYEKRVIFELTELPEGVPQNRLVELVSALKPRCRSIIARFDAGHKNFVAYRVAGLHAVGIDLYSSGRNETELMGLMEKFVTEAKKNQLRCYAEGIRTLSLFSIAMSLGFDYIAGYALSPVAKNAEEIHKFQLEEPYLAFLQALKARSSGSDTGER